MLLSTLQKDKDGKEIEITLADKEIDMFMQIINLANFKLRELPAKEFIKEREFLNLLEDQIIENFVML